MKYDNIIMYYLSKFMKDDNTSFPTNDPPGTPQQSDAVGGGSSPVEEKMEPLPQNPKEKPRFQTHEVVAAKGKEEELKKEVQRYTPLRGSISACVCLHGSSGRNGHGCHCALSVEAAGRCPLRRSPCLSPQAPGPF